MKLISRYILTKCLLNTCVMAFVFVLLFSIFSVLGQIGDLGKGNFDIISMIIYIILQVPNYLYLLMPLAILIGVMLAMLSLVNYSEYAVIRTSGISMKQIIGILLSFGICFSIITFFIGEVLAPNAKHYADVFKITKTQRSVSTQLRSGIWSKDGANSFVNIKQVMPDNTILGINIYNYDDKLNLENYIQAVSGEFNKKTQKWLLYKVNKYNYSGQNIENMYSDNYVWTTSITPDYFSVLVIPPEDMSAFGILKYIRHLQENKQSSQRYEIAFWNKLLYPISCISMSLIALLFIPNNRRNINLGSKLFIGILIGLSFFFMTRLIGFLALLFNWNAILSALTPTTILFVAGWYFVLRKQ